MNDGKTLSDIAWPDFHALSLWEKAPYLKVDGRAFHALLAQQFDREALTRLSELATMIRLTAKTKDGALFLRSLLCHKRAMLYFTQPSSRTYLSFCSACRIVGMDSADVRDRSTSSEVKGESPEDSIRTFSSYFDLVIMRSQIPGLAERAAWTLSNSERPIPIINAGSGKDQHPTQALLDIYTLQRSFEERGGIDGKSIVFVGDLARGRTVRSLAVLLTNYRDVKQYFVAPEPLKVADDILAILDEAGCAYEVRTEFKPTIPLADAIYMTRVQDEWDDEAGASGRIDISEYAFETTDLAQLKEDAILMHPFPRRKEIAVEVDHDPRAMYWRQMRNGMWIRAALIAWIFRCEEEIQTHYEQHGDGGED